MNRFRDPMNSNILSVIEEDIRMKVLDLKQIDASAMVVAVRNVETLIFRRNKLVKTSK